MNSYDGAEQEVFIDAIRLAPAIAASRARNAAQDTLFLYDGFLADAAAKGVDATQAWSIVAAANSVWVTQLFERQAALEGTCIHKVLESAVASAQNWVLTSGA